MGAAPRHVHIRYSLQHPLGHGGLGAVWAARDDLLGRDVAVKQLVLPTSATSEQLVEIRERALREARAAARISCPHVVRIFDVVEEDGQPWIVMERIPGRSLSQLIREHGRLHPARVIQIAQQVLAALTAAHASGVLHRDVKPSNVLIRPDGTAVLTDFGIAAVDGDQVVTDAGLVVGSADYLAPERASGGEATAATDMWSLGCLIYTAAEGRSPFARADSIATLRAVLTEEPTLPAGPLRPVLRGLLVKKVALRLSADTTRLMLRAAAASPLTTQRPPETERQQRRAGRVRGRRLPVVLAAFLAAGMLTVAAEARAGSDEQRSSTTSVPAVSGPAAP